MSESEKENIKEWIKRVNNGEGNVNRTDELVENSNPANANGEIKVVVVDCKQNDKAIEIINSGEMEKTPGGELLDIKAYNNEIDNGTKQEDLENEAEQ